jgi:hypothetical protein
MATAGDNPVVVFENAQPQGQATTTFSFEGLAGREAPSSPPPDAGI